MKIGQPFGGGQVPIRPVVLAALAQASLWPAGHAGGGLLLGAISGPGAGVTGAIQTWYRAPGGRVVHRRFAEYSKMLQEYPLIGAFTIGGESDPSDSTRALMATVLAEQDAVIVTLGDGMINLRQGSFHPLEGLPPMPLLLGVAGKPGLPGQRPRARTVLGVAAVAILLAAGAGVAVSGYFPGREEPAVQLEQVAAEPATAVEPPHEPSVVASNPTPAPSPAPAPEPKADPVPAPSPAPSTEPTVEAKPAPTAMPAPPPAPALPTTHIVQPGETLSALSRRYYNSPRYTEVIRLANNFPSSRIYAGELVMIPVIDPLAPIPEGPAPDPVEVEVAPAEPSTVEPVAIAPLPVAPGGPEKPVSQPEPTTEGVTPAP